MKTSVLALCLGMAQGFLQKVRKHDMVYKQPLENFQNAQYYGDMEIGGQKIKGIFDTGSFELLVLSSRCTSCRRHPYDYALSKTYVNNGTLAQHVFGSGPVISMQAYDLVEVGNMETKHQCFWEIVDHDIQVLEFAKFSAIVGIGHGYAPTNREKTLVMNYNITEFSVCLEKANAAPGWLMWGQTLTEKERDELTVSAPVVGDNHWGVKMEDVTIGSQKLLCEGGGCGAIVDSGTSLLAAPGAHLEALTPLLKEIKEDCSNMHELPMLYLTLGKHRFALPPKAYVMRITDSMLESEEKIRKKMMKEEMRKEALRREMLRKEAKEAKHDSKDDSKDDEEEAEEEKDGETVKASLLEQMNVWEKLYFKPKDTKKKEKKDLCLPAFMQLDKISEYGPVWILGMPFLRYYYTQFNRTDKKLYFARASSKCEAKKFEPVERSEALVEVDKNGELVQQSAEEKAKALDERMRKQFLEDDPDMDIPLEMNLRSILPPMWDMDKSEELIM